MAEPKTTTTRLKYILLAFAASAFAANGWLALAFAGVAASVANCEHALALVFAAGAAFPVNSCPRRPQ